MDMLIQTTQHLSQFSQVSRVSKMAQHKRQKIFFDKIPGLGKLLVSFRKQRRYRPSVLNRRLNDQETLLEYVTVGLNATQDNLAQKEISLHRLEKKSSAQEKGQLVQGDEIKAIRERVEFVRLELMYELQHQLGLSANSLGSEDKDQGPVVAKICNQKAVDEARIKGMKLNIGCGHKPIEGMINIDMRVLPNVDIQASVDNIPLKTGSVQQIHSAHLIEHFTEQAMKRTILPHWFDLLAPGGKLSAIVPDAEAMMKAWYEGELDFDTLRLITFGQQEYDGDFHWTMYSVESLTALLEGVGFRNVQCKARGRANGLCLEFELTADRP